MQTPPSVRPAPGRARRSAGPLVSSRRCRRTGRYRRSACWLRRTSRSSRSITTSSIKLCWILLGVVRELLTIPLILAVAAAFIFSVVRLPSNRQSVNARMVSAALVLFALNCFILGQLRVLTRCRWRAVPRTASGASTAAAVLRLRYGRSGDAPATVADEAGCDGRGVRPVDNGTGGDHDPAAPRDRRPVRQPGPAAAGRAHRGTHAPGMETARYGPGRNTTRKDDSEPNWLDKEPTARRTRSAHRTRRRGARKHDEEQRDEGESVIQPAARSQPRPGRTYTDNAAVRASGLAGRLMEAGRLPAASARPREMPSRLILLQVSRPEPARQEALSAITALACSPQRQGSAAPARSAGCRS